MPGAENLWPMQDRGWIRTEWRLTTEELRNAGG